MELLSAKAGRGTPGLYGALLKGKAETVTAYIHGLQELTKEGLLKSEQAMELLMPGRWAALASGKTEAVSAFTKGVGSLVPDLLTQQQANQLLNGGNSSP
jgi:hypothetical protein